MKYPRLFRHCEYSFCTETESVMTLVEKSAMKQSTTRRHCEYSFRIETESVMTLVEEYGDEAIRDRSSLRIPVSYRN
jgi:transcription elongation factor Elf1